MTPDTPDQSLSPDVRRFQRRVDLTVAWSLAVWAVGLLTLVLWAVNQ